MPLQVGDEIDRYVILAFIGAGGMGEIYRARDPRLDREVALKLVRLDKVDVDDGPATAAKIVREARAAAALEHPNVVAIFDVGDVAATKDRPASAYIAMELLRGKPLRAFINDPSVALVDRLRWLADVARALAAAHKRHIVHRDVKPDNVFIREDGVVKVLDFGIAKRGFAPLDPSSSTEGQVIPTLTARGAVVGTPSYMSPEQMRGEALDGRSDQFSWAVMAYELLCGTAPWRADGDILHLVSEILSKEPEPAKRLNPSLGDDLSHLLSRALSKPRVDRFESMDEIVDALDMHLGRPSLRASQRSDVPLPPPPPPSKRRAIGFTAMATLGVLGIALLARHRANLPPSAAHDAIAVAAATLRCTHHDDCRRGDGGAANWCRKSEGTCVALASEDCRVLAEPSDLDDERTVWIGAMFPAKGEDAAVFGHSNLNAVDLARRDFAQIMGGLNRGPAAVVPPIGVIACDDSVDPSRAARHLVDEVGAPAVIGFRTTAEALEIATSTLLPHETLAMVSLNTSPLIAKIPQVVGQPRLVWRTTYSTEGSAAAVAAVVSDVLEPSLRASPKAITPARPMRVALVRAANTAGLGFAHALFTRLVFNGKSALENGSDFREITLDDTNEDGGEPLRAMVESLATFAPHVVVYNGHGAIWRQVILPLEGRWREPSYRPRIISGTGFGSDIFGSIGKNEDLRKRVFATTTVSTTLANARFVVRYNELNGDPITRTVAPNSSYDAFYVLAYATYAAAFSSPEPIRGPSLARAIERLVPHGRPIDVGPEGIFDGFSALRSGGRIDLNGATSKLDFDLETGDAAVDQAILCVTVDDDGRASDGIESGLVYDAETRKLEGKLKCR